MPMGRRWWENKTCLCRQELSSHKLILPSVWMKLTDHTSRGFNTSKEDFTLFLDLSELLVMDIQALLKCISTRKGWWTLKPSNPPHYLHITSVHLSSHPVSQWAAKTLHSQFCKTPQNIKPNRDDTHTFHNIFIPIKDVTKPQVLKKIFLLFPEF